MSSVTSNTQQSLKTKGASGPSDAASRSSSVNAPSAEQLKQTLHDYLKNDLADVNQTLTSQLRSTSPLVSEMVDHVSHYQGKQLRPILLLLTQRMAAGLPAEPELADRFEHCPSKAAGMLAASVEMIHLATLVHDDVIDEAETRRHVATVHRRWDTEASVLLGDYLFSRAFHLAALTGDAASCALIGRATDRTCEGELNQVAARLEQSNSELDYFRIIRGKTGQIFGLSCRLGARAAGASQTLQAAATRFGLRLGLAFQIADDVLDLTETCETTGKDAANDVQNGRRTLPILRALKLASPSERQTLNDVLGRSDSGDLQVIRELKCIRDGIESAFSTAERLIDRACRDLTLFPDSQDRQLLQAVAEFAVHRRN